MIEYRYNDGGRTSAGRRGHADDCVTRAVAIAAGLSYSEVYDRLADGNATQRRSKHDRGKRVRSASRGIDTSRKWFKDYMRELGFDWRATMKIGTGCTVHLRADELPAGRLVVSLSGHYAAVIDGVLHDTYDCSRDGTRCVYGYYILRHRRAVRYHISVRFKLPQQRDAQGLSIAEHIAERERCISHLHRLGLWDVRWADKQVAERELVTVKQQAGRRIDSSMLSVSRDWVWDTGKVWTDSEPEVIM